MSQAEIKRRVWWTVTGYDGDKHLKIKSYDAKNKDEATAAYLSEYGGMQATVCLVTRAWFDEIIRGKE